MADTWDPTKDEAAREQCRSYGAPAILRVSGRLHITWEDGETNGGSDLTESPFRLHVLRLAAPPQERN